MIRNLASAGPQRARAIIVATLACLLLAIGASTASASVGMQIVNRCGHGQSISGYTVAQYKQALKEMPTEVLEYSDCAEKIHEAELAAAGQKGGSSGGAGGQGGGGAGLAGGGAAVQPTPAQRRILEATRHKKLVPISIGGAGGSVQPGVVHPNLASATSDLPTPVLIVIAMVLGGLLVLGGRELLERQARSAKS